jgi:phosphatidate cytidylyltransferase
MGMSQIPNKNQDKKSFLDRLWVSIIAVPVVAVLIWYGAPWFTLLVVAWGMGGAYEFYHLVNYSKGLSPLTVFGMLWVGLLIASPHFSELTFLKTITPVTLLLTTGVFLSLLIILWRHGKENAFADWAWTMGGLLYVGWLASFMVALRNIEDGRGWVFMAILCTFASDSSAYMVGRARGKHKMAPYISPKKSWEGAAAGLAGAVLVSLLVAWFFDLPLALWQSALMGFLISVFGQLGDLVKSLFKRNMEVKDSGHILPGHGGFLDRMDSLVFAGVVVYFFAAIIAG